MLEICNYKYKKIEVFQFFQKSYCSFIYVIKNRVNNLACIIDADLDGLETYLKFINKNSLKLVLALDTHIHSDHISALKKLRKKNIKTLMGYSLETSSIASRVVKDEEFFDFGEIKIKALHTPGHTSNSYCFFTEGLLFTGDTLLINSTGRTDLNSGSAAQLYQSIHNKILSLKNDTIIFPAHDYNLMKFSTLLKEKQNNPRLNKTKEEFIKLMDNLKLSLPKKFKEATSNSIPYEN